MMKYDEFIDVVLTRVVCIHRIFILASVYY